MQSVNINSVINLSAAAMAVFGYLWASLVNNKRLEDFKALMDANDKATNKRLDDFKVSMDKRLDDFKVSMDTNDAAINKRLDDFRALMEASDKAMLAEIRSVVVELRATRDIVLDKIDAVDRRVSRLEDAYEHRVLKP